MLKYFSFLLFIILCLPNCCKDDIGENNVNVTISNPIEYSFFIAGHTYGNPDSWNNGLYPEFVNFFPFINQYPGMSLGVLTGDVIPKDEDFRWDFALQDLTKIHSPVYITPGNHDLGFNIFYNRFGYFYKSFFHGQDLFILLTPSLDHWNITLDQLSFLENTLEYDGPKARNIYIFHHELIWWSPDNQFSGIELNWKENYPGSTNFWDEIAPLFSELNKPTYFFAGDLGARDYANAYMYYKENNIHLIASGMGAGINDNFIIAEVKEDGQIDFKLCAMQGKINRLGDLEDFILP